MPAVQNFILAALSASELSLLQDDLVPVVLPAGAVLCEADKPLSEVYFPTTAIISLLGTTQDGATTELAMVGREGMVGTSLVLGDTHAGHTLQVQTAGEALRLEAGILRWEMAQGGRLQQLALRYTQAVLRQIGQNFICAHHHVIEQQLCRWLLLCLERQDATQPLHQTQDRIASLLGVRREAVALGAHKLQAAGLIEYRRGRIRILNHAGLAAAACECHALIASEYARFYASTAKGSPPGRFRAHPASLRQRAEARWRERPAPPENLDAPSAQLHELEIRKIELEICNDALQQAFAEAEALNTRYADIYDFSPIGYFTLDAAGRILDLNLSGAILLGLKRSQKSRQRFVTYLAPECQADFSQFIDKVLHEKTRNQCEIILAASALRPLTIVRVEAVPDEERTECRMVLIDITEQRDALHRLEASEMRYRRFIANLPLKDGLTAQSPGKPS